MGLHDGHRQRKRERFLKQGADGLADHEVLELLLYYAIPRRDTNELAHRLIQHFGTLDAVFQAPPEALMQVSGIAFWKLPHRRPPRAVSSCIPF